MDIAISGTLSPTSFSINPSRVGTVQLRIRRCLGREDGESKRPQAIVMSPIWMREEDLPRLGEFEPFHIQFLQKVQLVWKEDSAFLHQQFEIANDILLLRGG